MNTLPPDPPSTWAPPHQSGASSGKATASLVLGICGLILCPLVCSVLAIVFGKQARREIAASGGRLAGAGNATAGIVLGWIGVALAAVGVILILAMAGLVASSAPSESGFG